MKNIKKTYKIKAEACDVYTALTNPLTIELWTDSEAIMSTEPNSEFSLFDGDIVGKNLRFEKDKTIVQQWYFDGEDEDSIVTINLEQKNDITVVELLHINIPDEAFENILDGWDNYYFKAIKMLLED
ncbi:MAG: SRPBCC domain-containing protein [Lentimicrobiaceae bacterium]|nr:SRPBCC domain-containing protein [Lentimicrobiaceae bacterium]